MRLLKDCFEANEKWVREKTEENPEFFALLSRGQQPKILWIGCSDSRIHPSEVIGRPPGELFVHRNVANVVVHTDMNCLSVLQYAVEVLHIEHVVVCGHHGCGGIQAAMEGAPLGLIDNWLRHIKDTYMLRRAELDAILDPVLRANALAEFNVATQVANLCHTTIVQDAWRDGRRLAVHGWILSLETGRLRDLGLTIEQPEQIPDPYRMRK
ncbi:MAG: carbonate dehydratase [Deltaproteobacteria bacterium]|nr:carbonate dehydratase [Deltaproteobacteria bacterium]